MAFKMKGNPFPKKGGASSPQKQRVDDDEVKMFSEDWKNEEEVPLTYEEKYAKWQEHSDRVDTKNREIDIENQILQNEEDLMTDEQKSTILRRIKTPKWHKMMPPPKPPSYHNYKLAKTIHPKREMHESFHTIDDLYEIPRRKIIRKKGSDFE